MVLKLYISTEREGSGEPPKYKQKQKIREGDKSQCSSDQQKEQDMKAEDLRSLTFSTSCMKYF
jgi:hypothetical protein